MAASGNVGVGLSAPNRNLEISGNSIAADQGMRLSYSAQPTNFYVELVQHFNGPGNGFNYNFNIHDVNTGFNGTSFSLSPSGNVGIGTSTPDTLLTVGSNAPVGTVAHFENSTGSCYINPTTTSLSCSSDARLKTNVVSLTSNEGLAALLKLDPVTFNWKTESATSSPHTGFIAQSVQPIFPDLISQGPDGFYTMNYAGLTPYLVKAVQQIATISDAFQQNLVAWLGNAANGITDIFAKNIHAQNELCVGSTCVTPQQFAAMVAAANQQSASPTSPSASASTSATSTPPVIRINGNNPATVQIGAAYNDLGAAITSPQSDLNLGISASVDGGATTSVSQITIDTRSAGTHTILYSATDQNGLTGTATRTVTVQSSQPTATTTTTIATTTSMSATKATN